MADEEQGNSEQEAKAAEEMQKKSAQERSKAIAEEQKKYALSPEETKNLSEQLKILAEQAVLAERIPDAYERGLKLTEIQIQREQTILESQGKRLELINKIAGLEAELEGLRGKAGEEEDKKRKALIQQIRDLNIVKERLDAVQKVTQQTADVMAEGFREGTQAFLSMFGSAVPFIDKLTNIQKFEGYLKAIEKELQTFEGQLMVAGKAVEKIGSLGKMAFDGFQIPILGIQVKGLTDTFKEFEQAKVDAFKSFGPQEKFEASMQTIRAEMLKTAGVAEKDLRAAYGNLNKSGVAVTAETAKFVAQMQKLGVESEKSAKLIKNLETSYQAVVKTTVSGTKIIDDMRKLGEAMGVGTSALVNSMDSLMPRIIGFGEKGPEVFKKTAIAAQALGVETNKLFEVMSQYDTFEKAANAAGEFNLALEGQFIDPMKLMEASVEKGPYETLKVLQKGFQDSGKSIDQMSPKFLKFAAEAAKMDVETFTKLFKGNPADLDAQIKKMEEAAKQQESMEEAAKKTQTTFQQMQNELAAAFANEDVMESVKTFVEALRTMVPLIASIFKFVSENIGIFMTLFAAGKLIAFGAALSRINNQVKLMNTLGQLSTALKQKETTETIKSTVAKEGETVAEEEQTIAKNKGILANIAKAASNVWAYITSNPLVGIPLMIAAVAGAALIAKGIYSAFSSSGKEGGGGSPASMDVRGGVNLGPRPGSKEGGPSGNPAAPPAAAEGAGDAVIRPSGGSGPVPMITRSSGNSANTIRPAAGDEITAVAKDGVLANLIGKLNDSFERYAELARTPPTITVAGYDFGRAARAANARKPFDQT